ncbi:MAG: CHASE2 domain-containing protein [Deltaproteobacteria bacterium]|nr:CHASE2 domain-containing protein [Deltaproteobacteria bacterium]
MGMLKRLLRNPRLLLVTLIGGVTLTALVQNFEMNLFEAYLYDLRMRASGTVASSSLHTVLVTIDDRALEHLNEYAPLSMRTHASLLKKLGQSNPKAIAYFVDFNDSVPATAPAQPKARPKSDADLFVDEAERITQSGVPVWLGTDVDVTGEVLPPFPLSKLPHRAALIHKDGTMFSEDNVTRRALFSIYDEPVLHVQLASLLTGKSATSDYRGVYFMPEVQANYLLINYSGDTREERHPFEELSAIDILDGKVPVEKLAGKIVLVGTKTKENSNDFVYTPYSRSIFTNPKLVVHANIVETLIKNGAILQATRASDVTLTFLLTCLVIAIVFKTTPSRGVIATVLCSCALAIAGHALFRLTSLWIGLSHPLVGISCAYYIFVPYRLIMEYKKRWDIQRKHEVLIQVEELKSNFMSLITHDLKTPVARIHGMAEVLERSGADPTIVAGILKSTDELNRFISSILELARIESNRVKLARQSKDINKIVEDCLRKFEFEARQKKIRVAADLEPMFPIRIDAPLITKVVSNLIDNAIKYSPEGAEINVKLRESRTRKGFVELEIRDTGFGIAAKDLENLFAKFYRPKNDITMTVKGTGLGLYLSRYFVELHGGSVSVESTEGKGSRFTILLPVDEQAASSSRPEKDKKIFFMNLLKNQEKPGGNAYV